MIAVLTSTTSCDDCNDAVNFEERARIESRGGSHVRVWLVVRWQVCDDEQTYGDYARYLYTHELTIR
jgi:hypothetical protein